MRRKIGWRKIAGLCAAAATLACAPTKAGLAEGQHPYRHAASVCIELTVNDDFSGPAFTTLRTEATRIWLRHGIALNWTARPGVMCEKVVPIVFDESKLRKLAGPKRDALALTEFVGRSQTIYVSAPRAFQMVSQLRERSTSFETIGERDFRLGTLMGRAVAHELGHVLLETTSHSATGLMRPIFSVKDALSVDIRATDLVPAENVRLAMRFSLVPLDAPGAPAVLAQDER